MKLSGKFKLIILVVFLLSFCHPVFAETVGFSVDRTIFSFDLDPGEEIQFKINIQAKSDELQQMAVDFQDFSAGDQNKISLLDEKNEIHGMKDWIEIVGGNNWFLEKGQKKELSFKIIIPENAVVGSHYAVAALKVLPRIDAKNFQSPVVSGRIAVYVLVNVKGEVSGSGKLTDFVAPMIVKKDVNLKAEFENTGNVHYIPHGEIVISSIVTGAETKLQTGRHFVFPGTKYSFDLEWQPSSIFGIYSAKAYFVDANRSIHEKSRILIGKYFFTIPSVLILAVLGYWKLRKHKKIS